MNTLTPPVFDSSIRMTIKTNTHLNPVIYDAYKNCKAKFEKNLDAPDRIQKYKRYLKDYHLETSKQDRNLLIEYITTQLRPAYAAYDNLIMTCVYDETTPELLTTDRAIEKLGAIIGAMDETILRNLLADLTGYILDGRRAIRYAEETIGALQEDNKNIHNEMRRDINEIADSIRNTLHEQFYAQFEYYKKQYQSKEFNDTHHKLLDDTLTKNKQLEQQIERAHSEQKIRRDEYATDRTQRHLHLQTVEKENKRLKHELAQLKATINKAK